MFIRKRRILQFLKRLFSTDPSASSSALSRPPIRRPYNRNTVEYKHLILVWPFIHLPGQTRSSVLVEVSLSPLLPPLPHHHRPWQDTTHALGESKSFQSFQSFREADKAAAAEETEEAGVATPSAEAGSVARELSSPVVLSLGSEVSTSTPSQGPDLDGKGKGKAGGSLALETRASSVPEKQPPVPAATAAGATSRDPPSSSIASANSSLPTMPPNESVVTENPPQPSQPLDSSTAMENLPSSSNEEHKAEGSEDDDEDEEEDSSDDEDDSSDEDDDSSGDSDSDSSSDEDEEKDEEDSPAVHKKSPLTPIQEEGSAPTTEAASPASPTRGKNPSSPSKLSPSPSASVPMHQKPKKNSTWKRFLGNFLYSSSASSASASASRNPNRSSLAKEKTKKVNLLSKFFPQPPKEKVSFAKDIFASDSSSDEEKDDQDDNGSQHHNRGGGGVGSGSGGRKKSLHLPKVIYTEPIEGQVFQSRVSKLANEEANLVSSLEFLGMPVAEECRVYTSKGYGVEDMKEIGKVPLWLQQHEKINSSMGLGLTSDSVHLEGKAEAEAAGTGTGTTGARVEDLLRDGRYGPRYEGLDMKLPVNYPTTAGLAQEALQNNLKKDQKSKEKIKKNRIPTASEVLAQKNLEEKRIWIPTPKWLQQRQRRREKRRQIEVEVGMNLMLSSGYSASRRESLLTLPGMIPHYPNPSYDIPARLPINYTPPEEEKRYLTRLFGMKKKKQQQKQGLKIQISEAVGRKPVEYSSQYQLYLQSLKEEELKKLKQREEEEKLLLRQQQGEEEAEEKEGGQGEVGMGGDSIASVGATPPGDSVSALGSISGPGSITGSAAGSGARRGSGAGSTVGSRAAGGGGSVTAESAGVGGGGDDQSVNTLMTKKTNNTSPLLAPLLDLAPAGQSVTLKLASYAPENQTLFNSKASRSVFLDRRGSYLVAPGLESFSKYLEEKKNPLKMIKFDEYGRPIRQQGSHQGKGKDEQETITPRKEIKAAGLIRVMNTNVSPPPSLFTLSSLGLGVRYRPPRDDL
jgi:hypothetical protein